MLVRMNESPVAPYPGLTIRTAIPEDADGITRTYMESAEFHAGLDPERYAVPSPDAIVARYREGGQHPEHSEPKQADGEAVTLVAELEGDIVGFVDARLGQSPDPMHRRFTYCYVLEIAVRQRHQRHGIGEHLLRAAEDWGQRRGAEYVMLEYLAGNTRAAEFYRRRLGYRVAACMAVKRLSVS